MCCVFTYFITINALFILSMLKPSRMEPRYPMLEEEYDKDHLVRYIEAGQVTNIVIFFYIDIGS
jgi:hypothetical protein